MMMCIFIKRHFVYRQQSMYVECAAAISSNNYHLPIGRPPARFSHAVGCKYSTKTSTWNACSLAFFLAPNRVIRGGSKLYGNEAEDY